MRKLYFLIVIFASLYSCELEELPVNAPVKGDENEVVIEMGASYEQQIWFDLGSNSIVYQNSKYDWDFAFACSDSFNHVYLNSALAMKAAVLPNTDLKDEIDPSEIRFYVDHSDHNPDSLALINLINTEKIAIVDLGLNRNSESRGFVKLKLSMQNPNTYLLEYCFSGDDEIFSMIIEKDPNKNNVFYSLDLGVLPNLEPEKHSFDVVFTQYTYQFQAPEPYLAYLVSGVLINSYNTSVAIIKDKSFDEIHLEDALSVDYSNRNDVIGFEWKDYDLDKGVYRVFPNINYVLKDSEGYYYKIHFTSFYGPSGQTGFPTFGFQRL